jgi:catechol 2,3-dioxygenase-like lactoylglutathione lyase family enzyme
MMKDKIVPAFRNIVNGGISRRRLLQSLGVTAASFAVGSLSTRGSVFAAAAEAKAGVFPVSTVNHLSLAVSDYARSRDWYVDLLGMRVAWDDGKMCALEFGSKLQPNGIYIRKINQNEKIGVGHFAFGTAHFMQNKDAMKVAMQREGATNIRPDGEVGWIADDPAGYMLNPWVPIKDPAMFPGAADPCKVAASDTCKAGYEKGLKNLASAPKPSGKGFNALYYGHIVLNVPEKDLPKEKAFYTNLFGMKVIYDNQKGPNPQIFLRFGQNTLILQKSAGPYEKPYCNYYGYVIENYNHDKVEAQLKSRGLDPKPNSKLAWTVHDPDGMRVEIAGPGLAEHLAKDCKGDAASCPGGNQG